MGRRAASQPVKSFLLHYIEPMLNNHNNYNSVCHSWTAARFVECVSSQSLFLSIYLIYLSTIQEVRFAKPPLAVVSATRTRTPIDATYIPFHRAFDAKPVPQCHCVYNFIDRARHWSLIITKGQSAWSAVFLWSADSIVEEWETPHTGERLRNTASHRNMQMN